MIKISKKEFGKLPDNRPVSLFLLSNGKGLEAGVMNYGAALVSLTFPDRYGKGTDIVLGHDSVNGYLNNPYYFGATVGRYANRIAKGKFKLNGVEYSLTVNEGENHLHGGKKGFDKVFWSAEPLVADNGTGIRMSYLSEDGEEGYPGNLSCTTTYWVMDDNSLKISYEAQTDKPTHVNLTHHSYFNLAGQGNSDILGHYLMINAGYYTPVGDGSIPTGKICNVLDTPMDFTSPHKIGERIGQVQGNYDHNFVIRGEGRRLAFSAKAYEPKSGIVMELHTTEPGIQLYSGSFLDNNIRGKDGKVYKRYSGFCLEPQGFPDSPNRPEFPSTLLVPRDRYKSMSVYKFYIENLKSHLNIKREG